MSSLQQLPDLKQGFQCQINVEIQNTKKVGCVYQAGSLAHKCSLILSEDPGKVAKEGVVLPPKPQYLGFLYTFVYHSPLQVAEDEQMGGFESTASLVDRAVCGRLWGRSDILDTKDLSQPMHCATAILPFHPEQGIPFPLASICSREKTVTANCREEVLSPPSISLKLSSLIYPLGCCYKLIKQGPRSLTLKASQPLISYYPSCSSTC